MRLLNLMRACVRTKSKCSRLIESCSLVPPCTLGREVVDLPNVLTSVIERSCAAVLSAIGGGKISIVKGRLVAEVVIDEYFADGALVLDDLSTHVAKCQRLRYQDDVIAILALFQLAAIERLLQAYICDPGHPDSCSHLRHLYDLRLMLCQSSIAALTPFESQLQLDPSGIYGKMDWSSQDSYRRAVWQIALDTDSNVSSIVAAANRLAACPINSSDPKRGHSGFWLFNGRPELSASLGGRVIRAYSTAKSGLILHATILLTLASLATALALAPSTLLLSEFDLYILGICILLVALDANTATADFITCMFTGTRNMPALDYTETGIPNSSRTAILVPALLLDEDYLRGIVRSVENLVLTANDSSVSVVVFVDGIDSPQRELSTKEEAGLALLRTLLFDLNEKLSKYANDLIFLVFRERSWSATERAWIGWERKRGKLEQCCQSMRGEGACVNMLIGSAEVYKSFRYILVVDDDSSLSKDSVQLLAASLDHPLSHPVLTNGRVTDGHCIAVPSTATRKSAVSHWKFAASLAGLRQDEREPHLETRSPMFDYLGQSHFPGKALISIDHYNEVCGGRMPDNILLSHDTVEGLALRPGFCGRALLTEGFPSDHFKLSVRQDRWIRGDFQNLWLVSTGALRRSKLQVSTAISWHVILHQCRLNLGPVFLFLLLLVLAWMPSSASAFLTLAVLLVAPAAVQAAVVTARRLPLLDFVGAARFAGSFLTRAMVVQCLKIVRCPYEAFAVVKSLSRTLIALVRGRRLLQWRAAAAVEREFGHNQTPIPLAGPSAASCMLVVLGCTGRLGIMSAFLIALWLASPFLLKIIEGKSIVAVLSSLRSDCA